MMSHNEDICKVHGSSMGGEITSNWADGETFNGKVGVKVNYKDETILEGQDMYCRLISFTGVEDM